MKISEISIKVVYIGSTYNGPVWRAHVDMEGCRLGLTDGPTPAAAVEALVNDPKMEELFR